MRSLKWQNLLVFGINQLLIQSSAYYYRSNKTWENGANHCVKSVRIRSFTGPYFPTFGLNTEQKNSEYGHFPHSELKVIKTLAFRKKKD